MNPPNFVTLKIYESNANPGIYREKYEPCGANIPNTIISKIDVNGKEEEDDPCQLIKHIQTIFSVQISQKHLDKNKSVTILVKALNNSNSVLLSQNYTSTTGTFNLHSLIPGERYKMEIFFSNLVHELIFFI